MKTLLFSLALLLFLWEPPADALKVQVGKFTYSLESVTKLKKLMDGDLEEPGVSSHNLCSHDKLPEEFYPVCEEQDAPDIFVKLVEAASSLDECELCANPACPGCS